METSSSLMDSRKWYRICVCVCVHMLLCIFICSLSKNLKILHAPGILYSHFLQDLAELKSFFLEQFHKEVKEVEYCVKGWNWGVAMFHGSLLKFMVGSTPAFEISLKEVSQVLWRGRLLAGFNVISFPDRVCFLVCLFVCLQATLPY